MTGTSTDGRVESAPAEAALNSGPRFHVVGIGASAGGLEALERLFEQMPTQTGMAFVVVQHLSPDFKSLMDELLARKTADPDSQGDRRNRGAAERHLPHSAAQGHDRRQWATPSYG